MLAPVTAAVKKKKTNNVTTNNDILITKHFFYHRSPCKKMKIKTFLQLLNTQMNNFFTKKSDMDYRIRNLFSIINLSCFETSNAIDMIMKASYHEV